jgi:hypothetical protein
MADKPNKLSDTARAVLALATTRDDHLIRPPHLTDRGRTAGCPIAVESGISGRDRVAGRRRIRLADK